MESSCGIGRAHAGDDVLALRIHQKFSVENFLAARGIARKRDAGARPVARVSEDHRLHVHRRAPFRGNVIFLAVKNRAFVHPRAENGADRAFELLPRIRREVAARAVLDELLEAEDEFPQLDDAELRWEASARRARRRRTSARSGDSSPRRSVRSSSRGRALRRCRRSDRDSESCPSCRASIRARPSARRRAAGTPTRLRISFRAVFRCCRRRRARPPSAFSDTSFCSCNNMCRRPC